MRRRSAAMLAAILIATTLGSIVVLRGRPATPMPQPTPTPAPQVHVAPVPAQQLAPQVIQRLPERGEELRPDSPISLVFDRAMDQASVAAALQITPAVTGRLSWPDARTALFTPNQALPRASQFTLNLGVGAKAQDGSAIAEALKLRFQTTGYLEIGQVIPAEGTQDAATTSTITVLFNRPVVPLTSVEQMNNLPQPLSFEPAISGRGAWLNTAIYVFTPDKPLASGINYTGRIAPNLHDALGNPLQSAFSWQFTTARPSIGEIDPADAATGVSVEPTLRVKFNGPIDQTSVQAITLRDAAGQAVATRTQLLTDTLLLTPTTRLQFATAYRIEVPAGSGAVGGGSGLASDFASSFRTAPLPKVIRTEPVDGAAKADPWTNFTLYFNAPINPDTVWPNIRVTPTLSATEVYSYYDTTNNAWSFNLGQRPSTDFTVEIGPGIADPFGNTTGQTLVTRFRTAPLQPYVAIVAPNIATYSSARPAQLALQATNMAQAKLVLYRLPTSALAQPIYNLFNDLPNGAQELRRWTAQLNAPANQPTINRVDLLPNAAALEAGLYLVEVAGDSNPQRHLMIVSPINLTVKSSLNDVLVWANDAQTGAPVPNLAIDLYEDTDSVRKLSSVTTGSDGVGRFQLSRSDDRGVIALATAPFAAMGSNWAQTISRWEFQTGGEFYQPGAYAYAYSERPIYRPGQQVHFKGLARTENDAQFTAPPAASVMVKITNPTGESVFDQPLQLGPNNTFSGDLNLVAGAPLGDYQIQTTLGDRTFSQSFRVAAYRAPEFEVTVAPSQPTVFRGETIRATVATNYLFGAPLAGAAVTWNVLAEPYQFAPDSAGRFQFGDSGSSGHCWECWWQPPIPPEPILTGTGTTDAQGNLPIEIPASALDAKYKPGQSVNLIIEAVATGRDNQALAGRSQLVAHAAGIYIGLAAQTYVGRAGQPQQIDIVAADQAGKALANQQVNITFQRVTWQNNLVKENGAERWESTEQVTPVGTATATTDSAGQATTSFTPNEGGAYRVLASARDSAGRSAQTTLTTWITGSDYTPWLRDSSDRITLVADKASYKPGETATILIPSPFQGEHWALITVERAGIKSYEVQRVASNSIVFQLPISAEDAPNVYVSATLFAGVSEGRTLADFKTGVLPITVEPVAQTLNVTLTPSQAQAEPGAKLAYDVQVSDSNGAGVAAELSLDLVDKGVLSLAPRRANDLAAALFAKRGLGVTTSSALTLSGDRTQEQLAQYASGRGGGGGPTAGAATPAATAAPAATAPLADSAQESRAQQPAAPAIRQNFADTAYWNASVTTDSSGRGRIELTLPDNLTTWTMRGVALTADTRAGEGTIDVVATKPLLIRPVTPRFFTVGDTAELVANVTNNTDTPLAATVVLSATGVTATTPLTQTVQIAARSEAQARWTVSVPDVTSADLVFSVTAGNYSDASKPRLATGPNGSLPVYRYSAPENVGTGGQLAQPGARGEVIALPPNADRQNGELTVRLDPSLAAGMRDGLRALEHYEYECAEQTVSRFLPNLLTARALKDLGVPNAELETKLPGLVNEGIARLASKQNDDDGWGWWPTAMSNPQVSAYAVFGLAKARDAGYSVPADMLERGQDYLITQLKPTASANQQAALSTADANQQAFLLFALAESGRADATRTGELFAARTKLATYAHALLAMALRNSGAAADDARIKALLSDLNTSAITSATGTHWEEAERDWWSMNTDTRTTAITLEALVRLDPAGGLNANIVRWLMAGRRDGAWATTQESAWSLMALTSYMARSGELQGNYEFAALLNGATLASGRATPQTIGTPTITQVKIADLLRDTGNVLTIGRGEGPGQLYYTAQLRSFLPVGEIKALDRGVNVQRRYTLASCNDGAACQPVTSLKVGDVLRVELSIIAPNDLYYLVVEDPLPAGVEAIDPALATASALDAGAAVSQQGTKTQPGEWRFPWWNWATRTELRDQKVVLFADSLAKGAYTFSYTVRATQAGEYRAIPTTASELYFPDVYGRGGGAVLRIAGR